MMVRSNLRFKKLAKFIVPFLLSLASVSFIAIANSWASPPKTLAVMPFENNAISDIQKYEPLSKGLAAMLTSDLSIFGVGLKLIEREKITSLLKEIALSQSGAVTESTALQAGKMSGAKHIAFGSFMVIGDAVRMDVRVVEVETSRVVTADSVMGKAKQFMDLERTLAQKIAVALNTGFNPPTAQGKDSMDAALYFSKGIAALDSGDTKEAKKWFDKCTKINPDYSETIKSTLGQR